MLNASSDARQLRAGELQCLSQRERKPESVYEAERERDHPAALARCLRRRFFEGHVDDRCRDRGFDERREPERVRRQIVCGCQERERVPDSERRDHEYEWPEAAERDHQAEQEQQVIGSIQDVEEPSSTEPQRRLMPSGIEPDDPGSPVSSNARSTPSDGRKRRVVTTRMPSRARQARSRSGTCPTRSCTRRGHPSGPGSTRARCRVRAEVR